MSCVINNLLGDLDADEDLTHLGGWIRVHNIGYKVTTFLKAELL